MTAASNHNGTHGALKLHQLGRRVGRQQLLNSLSLTVQPGGTRRRKALGIASS